MTFPLPNHCCIPPPQIELHTQPQSPFARTSVTVAAASHYISLSAFWHTFRSILSFSHPYFTLHTVFTFIFGACVALSRESWPWVIDMWCQMQLVPACADVWVIFSLVCVCVCGLQSVWLFFTHSPTSIPANPLLTIGTSPEPRQILLGASCCRTRRVGREEWSGQVKSGRGVQSEEGQREENAGSEGRRSERERRTRRVCEESVEPVVDCCCLLDRNAMKWVLGRISGNLLGSWQMES